MTAQDRIYDFRSFNWCSAQTLSALPPLQPRRDADPRPQVLAQPVLRSYPASTARPSRPAIRPPSASCSTASGGWRPELPTLRFMTSSSAPLLVDEWRRFEQRFGIRVSQGYGCSEIGWIAAHPGEQRRIGTVGRPLRLSPAVGGRRRRADAAAAANPARSSSAGLPTTPIAPRRRRLDPRQRAAAG